MCGVETNSRKRPLLSDKSTTEITDESSKEEELLNDFVKMHPMCNMEATSSKTMQLVQGMAAKTHIIVPEIPVVPKSHDDMFLCEADTCVGERKCVVGDGCMCLFIAKVRYGKETTKGFICKEYLLPEQHQMFLQGKGLPKQQQKCLVCSRYFLNYLYILARTDPNFSIASSVMLQNFCNPLCVDPEIEPTTNLQDETIARIKEASEMPTHSSAVSSVDGYRPHAMLFVDADFLNHRVQRETKLAALSFRPVVRFNSSHYRYVDSNAEKKQVVQVGIGMQDHLQGLGFQQPPSSMAMEGVANRS